MGRRSVRRLHALWLFLDAVWCGLLVAFAAGAGVVLQAATTRHAGGTVNRALLDLLDAASLGGAGALFLLLLMLDRAGPWTKVARGMTLRLLAVAAVAAIVSRYLITPEMMSLRERMGTIIDLVPKDDPLRKEWGRLHALSALALLVRIGCAAGLFALGVSQLPDRPTAGEGP